MGPQSWTWLSNGTELTWMAQIVKNLLAVQETRVWSLGQEDSLENGMAAHCFLWMYSYLEKSIDRGAWQAAVHGVTVSQTQLSNSLLSNFTFHIPVITNVYSSVIMFQDLHKVISVHCSFNTAVIWDEYFLNWDIIDIYYISFRCTTKWSDICVYCKMIIIISLVKIHHRI